MEIEVSPRLDAAEADTVAVAVADPPEPLPPAAQGLGPLLESGAASAERGRARLLTVGGVRLLAAGAGPRGELDADALRDAAAAAVRELASSVGGSLAWLLDDTLLDPPEQARAVVDGLLLGGYDPGTWRTGPSRRRPVERAVLVSERDVAEETTRAAIVARWANRARDLANRPPNDLTPERLVARAEEIAERFERLTVEPLGPAEIRALGMGCLWAVGKGSDNAPWLVAMRYEPEAPACPDLVLGLVGKGITFDAGGITIKPGDHMEDMKGDMAGGGAIVEAMGAIAELSLPLTVLAVVAAAENMPGSRSFRPGDILTAMNGKTIEVTSTDCEGRLVLADALCYARREGATHLVDLATLTGTMERALGDLYAGVFANDPAWRDLVVAAGEASGDHAWPLPLHPRYRRFLDSAFADLKNFSVRRQGIPCYAAQFLAEFAGDGPWAHVDMAGTGFLTWPRGDYLSQTGGTGYGVRLLVELARRLARP